MSREFDIFPGYDMVEGIDPIEAFNDHEHALITGRSFHEIDEIFDKRISTEIDDRISRGQTSLSILDVGGGWASNSAVDLFQTYKGRVNLTNLDVVLPRSPSHLWPVQLVLGDAADMPIESETQDIVYSAFVIHYLDFGREIQALSEIARVLRPGGIAFLTDGFFSYRPTNSAEVRALAAAIGADVTTYHTTTIRKPLES